MISSGQTRSNPTSKIQRLVHSQSMIELSSNPNCSRSLIDSPGGQPHHIPHTPVPTVPQSFLTVAERYLSKHTLNPGFTSKYLLRDELGSGGFGFVCSAFRIADMVEVAVKFILKEKIPVQGWARDSEFGVMPLECYFIRKIRHPNIVNFLDYFEDSAFCYLITELHGSPWNSPEAAIQEPSPCMTPNLLSNPSSSLSNIPQYTAGQLFSSPPQSPLPSDIVPKTFKKRKSCDLFECIEQHQYFTEHQAQHIFRQIASAIYFLHTNGVVHRDIKDENILVDKLYHVKIIDFGSASFIPRDYDKLFDRFLGTIQYAAPEIFKGEKYRGPEAEIWSLGCCLFVMLTGAPPFDAPQQAIHGDFNEIKNPITEECLHILRWMLSKDPIQRPTIQQVVQHPWLRYPHRH